MSSAEGLHESIEAREVTVSNQIAATAAAVPVDGIKTLVATGTSDESGTPGNDGTGSGCGIGRKSHRNCDAGNPVATAATESSSCCSLNGQNDRFHAVSAKCASSSTAFCFNSTTTATTCTSRSPDWDAVDDSEGGRAISPSNPMVATDDDDDTGGVCTIDVECPQCGGPAVDRMQPLDIPGFRQCFIMVFLCSCCGARSNEVKQLGAYGPRGRRWILRVEHPDDLNRDVLKSDTASIVVPEVELELCTGTLGGVFTTVEGLIVKVADQLENTAHVTSDTENEVPVTPLAEFVRKLRAITLDPSTQPFHFIVDDPADLSGISRRPCRTDFAVHASTGLPGDSGSELLAQTRGSAVSVDSQEASRESAADSHQADEQLVVESYVRTREQDDDLGLSDMSTEGCVLTPL